MSDISSTAIFEVFTVVKILVLLEELDLKLQIFF
jgi:hypothetical protein